ncbi:hypothetical protein WJX72_004179 [[Myrmecia] bisecta]|uniref:Nucleosome assembly protein n=1 Tax=[Myrmecia] bisecta TaxID=41462 RepID=A0AAW1P5J9_9CHLO
MAGINSVENFNQLDPAAKAQLLAAAGGNKELINAIQAKLNTMIGKSSGFIESLPPLIQARIEFLRDLQSQHDEVEEQFLQEKAELEAKYRKLYEPLYAKRSAIVTGQEEIPADQVEEATKGQPAPTEPVPKGIPSFWAGVLRANEVTGERISEKDEAVLEHLTDIRCESLADAAAKADAAPKPAEGEEEEEDEEEEPKGFRLIFSFEKNPFFTNDTLTKTYYMVDEEEPILERAEGTEINWNPGKNPTVKVMKKKAKAGKGRPAGKPLTKTEPCDSFFNFFSPPAVPEDDEQLEEAEMEELQNALEEDYDIGETIRDKLIPHAVSYYTGEAAESDEEDDEDYDEDQEEGDDEDSEGDDEGEEEEEEGDDEAPGGAKLAKAPVDTKEQPAECKQQ